MNPKVGPEKGHPFELGPWRVEPGLDRLSRGSESVPIEPRAMDLLVCLAQRAGETVSKETLLEEVWKGAFVVEGVIPKTLSALRAALGDDASEPTFILTVQRRGYRLIVPVHWLPDAHEAPPRAIAEAPQANTAPAPVGTPPAGDDHFVHGRASRHRSGLLLTVLGLSVAGALGWLFLASGKKTGPEPVRSSAAVSESVERLVLEARNLWAQRGFDSVRRASELMEQAVNEAPESAQAHAWLALSLMTRASYLGGGAAGCEKAADQARRALELDPDDPIALCASGVLAIQVEFDARKAIPVLERAIALDPTFVPARQFLAEAFTIAGQNDRALETIDQALALEPLSALLHGVKGNILLRSDRPLSALEAYERVLVLEPKFSWVLRNRAIPLVRLGRSREAAESIFTEARLAGERPEYLATLRSAIDRDGLLGYWRWRLERIETVTRQGLPAHHFQYAEALAGAGYPARALVELAQAAVCPDADYFFYLRDSPAFDSLRHDPRFIAIYARTGQ